MTIFKTVSVDHTLQSSLIHLRPSTGSSYKPKHKLHIHSLKAHDAEYHAVDYMLNLIFPPKLLSFFILLPSAVLLAESHAPFLHPKKRSVPPFLSSIHLLILFFLASYRLSPPAK